MNFQTETCPQEATAVLLLSSGDLFWGKGIGSQTSGLGELCFNTSLTGYQEILSDPSYARQIICFTFPHIGNVGTNDEDMESLMPTASGLVIGADITKPSNFRSTLHLNTWLEKAGLPGISNLDTREITRKIRRLGAPSAIIIHEKNPQTLENQIEQTRHKLQSWQGLKGMDLATTVTTDKAYSWKQEQLSSAYGLRLPSRINSKTGKPFKVVFFDFGAKHGIMRCLTSRGCDIRVVPASTSAEAVLSMAPDGVFMSNGPGDPEATGLYSVPVIKKILEAGIPVFGICLGHQILALALGAKTIKMQQGHRGGNHPVQDLHSERVEITSQNHGFCIDEETLPETVEITHRSLFDGTNEGIRSRKYPAFSVQYHPEASPGPEDSQYLFDRFTDLMEDKRKK